MIELFTQKANEDSPESQRQLFEQYRMYVDLADKISQRRTVANGVSRKTG